MVVVPARLRDGAVAATLLRFAMHWPDAALCACHDGAQFGFRALPAACTAALPKTCSGRSAHRARRTPAKKHSALGRQWRERQIQERSEEHTSELQSRQYLVCRLLLE